MAAHTPETEKGKQSLETIFKGKDVGFSRQRPENSLLQICKELKETLLEEVEGNTTVLQETENLRTQNFTEQTEETWRWEVQ